MDLRIVSMDVEKTGSLHLELKCCFRHASLLFRAQGRLRSTLGRSRTSSVLSEFATVNEI